MAATGTLRSWNDDRGFGFIAPTDGGRDIFVHISAFPRDGSRPTIGERLNFELSRGQDGKTQATRVVRLAVGRDSQRRSSALPPRSSSSSWLGTLAVLLVVGVVGTIGYNHFSTAQKRRALADLPATSALESPAVPAQSALRCDGRTHCSQMTSCAEAKWFINNCPGTQMDGNNDGVPCEQQWCTSPFSK